jgi:MoxR-like ATPase
MAKTNKVDKKSDKKLEKLREELMKHQTELDKLTSADESSVEKEKKKPGGGKEPIQKVKKRPDDEKKPIQKVKKKQREKVEKPKKQVNKQVSIFGMIKPKKKKTDIRKIVKKAAEKISIKEPEKVKKKKQHKDIKNVVKKVADKIVKKKENEELKHYLELINQLKKEVSKVVVGQDEVVEGIIKSVIAKGHVLVEGVPGIAKSLVIRAIAVGTGCQFGRIQFTVDLLPTDIIGITTLTPDRTSFEVLKGPIFNNFVMADEINRAPPKTQSALLEAMAEMQVTISRQTYNLDQPFFVMATQNPIESAGTYPLPEAQLDRFLFKLKMDYPIKDEEKKIIEQNISLKSFESYGVNTVMTPENIIEMQRVVHTIEHTGKINDYIVEIVNATRNPKDYKLNLGKYISLGASPRASIFLFVGAKADAFVNGHTHVSPQNIKNVAADVLRHRIKLNYRAQIDRVTEEDVIKEIVSKVKIP